MSMNTALLLLAIQNDYFPNGKFALEKSLEVGAKTQMILKACREMKLLVIHVQHVSTRPNDKYLLPCTHGVEFHSSVQPLKHEPIIKKHYPNSFKDTSLFDRLKNNKIQNLIICGMTTHSTIDATVRAAYDFGFNNTVIHDACAARQLEFDNMIIPTQSVQSAFLAALQPIYANVIGAEEYLHRIGTDTRTEAVA